MKSICFDMKMEVLPSEKKLDKLRRLYLKSIADK